MNTRVGWFIYRMTYLKFNSVCSSIHRYISPYPTFHTYLSRSPYHSHYQQVHLEELLLLPTLNAEKELLGQHFAPDTKERERQRARQNLFPVEKAVELFI